MLQVAACVGFAGTHSISEILSGIPGVYVSHGSQNIRARTPIGVNNQTPEAFLADMRELGKEYDNVVAIHTLFPPELFKNMCNMHGVEYRVIVRQPNEQVKSCYSWMLQKLQQGDESLRAQVMALAQQCKGHIEPTLQNAVYMAALTRIMTFNLAAITQGALAMHMERILTEEAFLKEVFGLEDDLEIPHFHGQPVHRASHVQDAVMLNIPDPETETIQNIISISANDKVFSYQRYKEVLGYH